MKRNARRSGFTLMELLIVIAIVGILAAMLFPAINFVREKARKDECLNNLRQWGVAMQGYLDEHRGVFPTYGSSAGGKPTLQEGSAWYNVLPPYIGVEPLKEMRGKLPHPGNGIKSVFLCPSEPSGLDGNDPAQNMSYFSSYTLNSWVNKNKRLRLAQIKNPAEFVIFAETGDGQATGINLSLLHENAFRHSRSFNVCFADGHTENVHISVALPSDSLGESDNCGGLQWNPENDDPYGTAGH